MIKKYLEVAKNILKRRWILYSLVFVSFFSVNIISLEAASPSLKTTEAVTENEAKTLDLLSQIDIFTEEDARLKLDSAKAHYNMGNVYYQKGEYEIAVREYYQSVILMPNDPDAHYNLAYVSGEYLRDYATALKHYKMYLYLNPKAKDLHYVREKIVEADLAVKSAIDSPIDKE